MPRWGKTRRGGGPRDERKRKNRKESGGFSWKRGYNLFRVREEGRGRASFSRRGRRGEKNLVTIARVQTHPWTYRSEGEVGKIPVPGREKNVLIANWTVSEGVVRC